MFSRVLFIVLILASIVLSQNTLTKTKSTINYWIKNTDAQQPAVMLFYRDAASKLCSVSVKKDSIVEVPFSNATPILWQGSATIHVQDYTAGAITSGTVVTYEPVFTVGALKYSYFYIKNNVTQPFMYYYTHPIYGADSIQIPASSIAEVVCATNNITVSCESGASVAAVVLGDRLEMPYASRLQKSGKYISFWIKNTYTTSKIFWYTNANGTAASVTVPADGLVEVNYVSTSTNVWTGTATTKVIQSPGTLVRGDFITYSQTSAVEVSPNVKGFSFENVNVDIFNLKGQMVAKSVRLVSIRGLQLTSGLYVAKAELASNVYSKRILITK